MSAAGALRERLRVGTPGAPKRVKGRRTRRIYTRDAERFARRHRAAGGRAWHYTLSFGTGALTGAHAVDLPLLFPHRSTWEASPLLAGIPWDDVVEAGREVRRVWAGFARTGEAGPAPSLRVGGG